MDANKIQQEGKEFAEKLSSADQIDFDYAINQYFEDHAQYITDAVRVAGVSKIKKLFTLASNVKAEGKVVGQPRYNSHHQTLSFKTTSTYVSPTLPAIVPLHARFSGLKTTRSWTVVAHLAPNNDDQGDGGVKGQKLFVTKLEASSPTYGFIPLGLLRPLTTLVLLFAASAIAFTQKHKSDNPIQFVLAAVAAVWSAMWETLVAESSRRQAQAEQWRDKKGPQLRQLYDQAVNTATKVQGDLEARAKAAGVAVEDYKTRAAQAVADLSENVEARAKAAGVPVDEYRKQAESIIADLRKRAGEAGERVQDTAKETVDQAGEVAKAQKNKAEKPKDKVGKTNRDSGINNGESNATANGNKDQNGGGGAEFVVGSDQPAKSHEEIQAEFDQVPHTPLGGHDPTAANAPTYALAAQI